MHFRCCTKQTHFSVTCKAATTHLNFDIKLGNNTMFNRFLCNKTAVKTTGETAAALYYFYGMVH